MIRNHFIRSFRLAIFALILLYPVLIFSQVKSGIDVLTDRNYDMLSGKKVGLITNPTGVNAKLVSTIDLLHEAKHVDLKVLFGPEHGVRGDYSAGVKVSSKTDPITGLPVHSLYGKNRKPTQKMLEGLDVLVFDIQDIGVRSYTYISTMGLAMEAAAEHGIEFIVLDRPNPLGGYKIEGNIAEQGMFSFVGAFPIPYVYGLTCGELAQMINEEAWLKNGRKVKLKVVKMKGWDPSMDYSSTGLHWVPSSPHIPKAAKAPYYVASGILGELGVFNIGVGYTLPFELFGTDFLNPELLIDQLNTYYKGRVLFRSLSFKPYYGKSKGKVLHGLQFYIIHPDKTDLISIQFKFLEFFHQIYPNYDVLELCTDRHNMFDKVCGSKNIREVFFQNYRYRDIEQLLKKDIDAFRSASASYYLYER